MELIFKPSPRITIATNTFINVPIILQYEDTPLLEVIKEQEINFTTQIPIYHSDGTYLAKVKGNRIFPTPEGKKANIKIKDTPDKFICSLENKVIFELSHGKGDEFKAEAELYAPDGRFVKCSDSTEPELFDLNGNAITIDGIIIKSSTFENLPIGIWIGKNSIQIGKQVYTGRNIP